MPSESERFIRRSLLIEARRLNREQAEECLLEVSGEFAGRTYDELMVLMNQSEYRTAKRASRTFTVIIAAGKEDDSSLNVTFQVDDGGLNLYEPLTRSATVRPGETFPGFTW